MDAEEERKELTIRARKLFFETRRCRHCLTLTGIDLQHLTHHTA